MKRYGILWLAALVAVMLASCGGKKTAAVDDEDEEAEEEVQLSTADSLSYAAGAIMAGQFNQYNMLQQLDVDTTYLADFGKGVKSVADMMGDKAKMARLNGLQIGFQLDQMATQNSAQYLGGSNAVEQVSARELAAAFAKTLEGNAPMSVDEANSVQGSFVQGNDVSQLSRAIGVTLADNFKEYGMLEQLNVDDADLSSFLDGVKEGAGVADASAQTKARLMGMVMGTQVLNGIDGDERRIFGADSTMHLSKTQYAEGFACGVTGRGELMSTGAASDYVQSYITNRQKAQAADDDFLKQNKRNPGVVTTESGLQYTVVRSGDGRKPTADNTVKVHYEGRLVDGTVFDSSYERGEPATFGLKQVIAGWTEGLQLMPVGSEYVLYIPSYLGYGDRDLGNIPPNSTLIFKVELLDIVE